MSTLLQKLRESASVQKQDLQGVSFSRKDGFPGGDLELSNVELTVRSTAKIVIRSVRSETWLTATTFSFRKKGHTCKHTLRWPLFKAVNEREGFHVRFNVGGKRRRRRPAWVTC